MKIRKKICSSSFSKISLLGILVLGTLILIPAYAANPSEKFTFQGVLKDSAGSVVTATKDITLDFYTASTGGTLRFSNLCDDTSVSSGVFTCTLTKPYDGFFKEALFVEVKVANSDGSSSETLSPRIEMVGAPYSIATLNVGNNLNMQEKNLINATSVNATAIEIGQTGAAIAANITATGSGTALNVTNTGSGTSFRVNDESDDTSPFLIDATGKVAIGTTTLTKVLNVVGDIFSVDNLFVGSTTESIGDSGFALDGDDVFISGKLGVEDDIFIDGSQIVKSTGGSLTVGLGDAAGDDFIIDEAARFIFESDSHELGIGIADPTAVLHIVDASTDKKLRITNTGNSDAVLVEDSAATDTTPFVIDASGNVGIGEDVPTKKLHVVDSQNGNFVALIENTDGTDPSVLQLKLGTATPAIGEDYIVFADSGGVTEGRIRGDGADGVQWFSPAGANVTTAGGDLTLQTSAQLKVIGVDIEDNAAYRQLCIITTTDEVVESTSATSCAGSSIRYKENIVPIGDIMSIVQQLRPVTFDYIESGQPSIGFIAEEVEQVPIVNVLVNYDEEGLPSSIDYEMIVAVLTKAIQEQQDQIEDVKAQNDALKELVCTDHPDAQICSDKTHYSKTTPNKR